MAARRPSRKKPTRSSKPTLGRRIVWALTALMVVGACVGALLVVATLIRLDGEIRSRFAGVRWALPAQVFAAPLELYPGAPLDAGALNHELRRLGYRALTRLERSGSFVSNGNARTDVHVRGFDFWDGPQAAQALSVRFAGGRVDRLLDADSGEAVTLARLDPLLIGSIYPQHGEDRVLVQLDEVPTLLKQGLMAVEDRNFYGHWGISPKGILRAGIANLRAGSVVQGGSTLTQQLVKNFFLDRSQTWTRKINEAFMAVLLEVHYDKDEILEAYLNEVNLGQDGGRSVNGFGLGAQFYFNKPLTELLPHEMALMIGLVKGPSFYNPRRQPERSLQRRDLVLQVWRDDGLIAPEVFEAAVARPLDLAGSDSGGVERYPAFVDLVRRQLRTQYEDDDLTQEGLRVFTTLRPHVQEVLERQVATQLPAIESGRSLPPDSLEVGAVVTNVEGGEVLALAGGRNSRFAGFNRALDARRQMGSLAKPFVFHTALSRPDRYHLYSWLLDQPIEVKMPHGPIWAPKNYDQRLHGDQPLFNVLAQSYNLPTVRVGLEIGPAEVLKTMQQAGLQGTPPPLPSLLLGALAASPFEVAQMYATLAAGGYQVPLSAIRDVLTADGEPLSRFPLRVRQALPEAPTFLVNWAMEQVMLMGTGRSAYNRIDRSLVLAGKTGTTDNYRDAWFAGFGGDTVAVVWVGRDDNESHRLTGTSGALPIWAGLMQDLNVLPRDALPPQGIEFASVDPQSGLRADDGCTQRVTVPFVLGYADRLAWAPCADAGRPTPDSPVDWFLNIFQGRPQAE
jgi:penicillin-binding protein 1B